MKVDNEVRLGDSHQPYKVTKVVKGKRIGVVGITKAENAQLGLILKYIFTNDEVYQALKQENVMVYPEAFKALCARYSS